MAPHLCPLRFEVTVSATKCVVELYWSQIWKLVDLVGQLTDQTPQFNTFQIFHEMLVKTRALSLTYLCIFQWAENSPHQQSAPKHSKGAVDHDPLPSARDHKTLLWLPSQSWHWPEPRLLPQTSHPSSQGGYSICSSCRCQFSSLFLWV